MIVCVQWQLSWVFSASYLSAIENSKRNIPPGFLEVVFKAYSIPDKEKKKMTVSIYNSMNNYKIDLSNLSDKKRQVLLSVAKEELDDSTIDKLFDIVADDSSNKTEKL